MQLTNLTVLSAITTLAGMATTATALKATHEVGLQLQGTCGNLASPAILGRATMEKRGCRYASCDDCYENESICQVCASEGDNLAACIVW